jgi:predicted dehydrogenase
VGFAGLGVAGKAMIQHLPKVPSLRLAAVQDVNGTLAAAVATEFSSPWHGDNYEEMLAADGVEVVVISTPNVFHVPQAHAALSAGKQVLVQKPLATSAADARATIDLADRTGRMLFVDYSYRLLETAETARAALPEIGALESITAAFHNAGGPAAGRDWFLTKRLSGGGALIDLGVHMLDFLMWLTQPDQVLLEGATIERDDGYEVEHRARLGLRLDGVPVQLGVGWNAPTPTDISIQLAGERGSLEWTNVNGSFAHFRTLLNGRVLLEREITLRENTLHALSRALETGAAPPIDARVYDVLDQAYARG